MEHAEFEPYLQALGIPPGLPGARGLRRHPEAAALEVAETGRDGREHLLTPEAAAAWRRLRRAAERDGQSLFIVSAFRSVGRQVEIIRGKLEAGGRIEEIVTVLAPPGYSEHHTGRAVDVSTAGIRSLQAEFESTAAFGWLERNAAGFGFTLSYPRGNTGGYQYEPWHWCYHPL